MSIAGAIRRILRCRLLRDRTGRQDRAGWHKGTSGRLRLHSAEHRRIHLLLQQRDVHLRREDGRLRDRGMLLVTYHTNSRYRLLMIPHRSRTSNALNFLPDRVPAPNRPPAWRNPSTSSPLSFRPSPVTRSTSVPVRTETSAQCGVPSVGSSTSVSLNL
jgi:hypothetical protein